MFEQKLSSNKPFQVIADPLAFYQFFEKFNYYCRKSFQFFENWVAFVGYRFRFIADQRTKFCRFIEHQTICARANAEMNDGTAHGIKSNIR